ncbi:Fic family protein [Microbacterium sp. SA39]|uniref:Fic family protein n=1 Tax=Microbacterium sp. SA39 TaxID=1263625 RepID=UPI00061FACCD|nr:Fic family protein [Microbacterium sp. SA39]KJQ52768.1 Adenosine monophosphate-protein transferase SoFic [Microbacterium sp. SA39]
MPTPVGNTIPVEPVALETFDWTPRAPQMHSRAEVERQTGSYEAAITPSIAAWAPRLSSEDSTDVEDATRQLVAFDQHAQRTLGSGNPALGPMTAILLRTESASSSQIEHLTTSAKQLALAEIDESDKANALTVIGNVRAMEAALQLADAISADSILATHRALMLHQRGFDPVDAGRFRSEQVWIGPGDAGPRTADFVAPHHDRIPDAIADLVALIRRQDLPVLVQVAVAHAQFETIHPFPDGNGRTGRALAQSILRNKGLVGSTAVPISAGLLVDVDRYFGALSSFREGDAGPIIREFAMASRIAATTGTKLVDDLAAQLAESRSKMKGIRSDAAAWKLLPTLVGQPAVNTRYLMNELGFGEMAALRALDVLVDRGVLTETTGKSRGRVWQHHGIFEVLDDYAAQIRRMSAR